MPLAERLASRGFCVLSFVRPAPPPSDQHVHPAPSLPSCVDICSEYPTYPNRCRTSMPTHSSDSEMDRPRASVEGQQRAELAPVPGWVGIVRVASAAAAASEPPGSFLCRARWGRLCWYDVRGSRAFVELLWALEELSATLCEVCGAPAVARDTWERGVHTLCPRHAVAVAAAGPNASAIYDRGWASLADQP